MKPLGPADPATAGPYRLLAELGRGGMGRVLLGAAPDGRLVAVKQVHRRLAADTGFRARFRREVAASRKVSGAYTAAVMDADADPDEDAQAPWFASVFVNGPSLGAAVADTGPLPEEPVRRLAAGLATALVEIHRAGLIHRDLKPENVLLAEDGVRVIDFGIARVAESTGGADGTGGAGAAGVTELTQTGWLVGSPAFMSPEQAEGREPTPAADMFSLGAVLAMAVTGHSPFAGTSMAGTLYNVVHAEPDLSALPPGLRAVVGPCLAKDPAARPTPEGLLGLIGAVAPADRPWPPAVHRMIAAQRADIDRLLGDTDRTLVPGPVPADGPAPADAPALAPADALAPAPAPVDGPTAVRGPAPGHAPSPRHRRTGRVAALAVACVLAVAGIGAGAYALSDTGTKEEEEPAAEPDKYTKAPVCPESAGQLPLPARVEALDYYDEGYGSAETSCAWGEYFGDPEEVRVAGLTDDLHALVSWDLKRSDKGDDATGLQREAVREGVAEGRRAEGLGFGDEGYWSTPEGSNPAEQCVLHVRDGNLMVQVALGGDEHPASSCESEAREIARAAISAMPRG